MAPRGYLCSLFILLAAYICSSHAELWASNLDCSDLIKSDSIYLSAVGVENQRRWIIMGIGGREEEIFSEGETAFECLKVVKVTTHSAVLKATESNEQRRIFLTGGSHRLISPEEASLQRTLSGAQLVSVSPQVTRIGYPRQSSTTWLPKSIYWNRQGEELFSDSANLGIGDGAELLKSDGRNIGVRLGENTQNSVFGGLGLMDHQIIVSINAKPVGDISDIGQLLKESANAPVEIVYLDGVKNEGFLSTYTMISARK